MASALFIIATVFVFPGYLLARLLVRENDGLERLAVAFTAGPLVIGWLTITLSVATGEPVSFGRLLGIALAVNAVAGALLWRSRLDLRLILGRGDGVLLAIAVLVAALYLVHYDRELFQFNCVNRAASLVFGAAQEASESGYILEDNRNVRLGNAAVVAPMFIAFDFLGTRLCYAWTGAMLFLWGVVLARRLGFANPWAGGFGLLLAVNPFVLAIPILDENLFSALATTILLGGLLARRMPVIWLGFVFGFLVGFRHLGLLMAPGLAWAFAQRRPSRRDWLRLVGAASLVGALWAYHHLQVFGSVLGFESFSEYHTDHAHSFLGVEFGFRGLLGAPFSESLVRTPYQPYPAFAMLPLWFLNRFGLFLAGLIPLGLYARRTGRLASPVLAAIALPILLLLCSLESIMQPNKLGIVLIVLPCLLLPMLYGARFLVRAPVRGGVAWAGFVLGLAVMQVALARIDAAPDPRVLSLEDPVRAERPEYRDWERAHLVRHNLLPDASRYFEYTHTDYGRKFDELFFDLTTRHGVNRTPIRLSPPLDSEAAPIVIAIDLSRPPIAGGTWVSVSRQPPHVVIDAIGGPEKQALRLAMLPWAEYTPLIGIASDPDRGVVDVALEFNHFAWSPDLPPEGDLTVPEKILNSRVLRIAVPPRTTIRFTEVVADHYSRYYRWTIRTDGGLTVSAEPTVVFTN